MHWENILIFKNIFVKIKIFYFIVNKGQNKIIEVGLKISRSVLIVSKLCP
jgi:hypothetical protein